MWKISSKTRTAKMATKNLPLAPRQAETGFRFSPHAQGLYNFLTVNPRTCRQRSAGSIPNEQLTRRDAPEPRELLIPIARLKVTTARISFLKKSIALCVKPSSLVHDI